MADIATIIDIMAGKGGDTESETPEEKAYTSCPDANHPHWIDLGIGTQWRCCNAGASSPEEYGGYWSSTPYVESSGYNLNFSSGNANWRSDYRYYGFTVRPVR